MFRIPPLHLHFIRARFLRCVSLARACSYVWWPRRTFPTAEITAARRRPDGAPTALRRRTDGGPPAVENSSGPTALRRRPDVAPTTDRRRPDVAPMADRRRPDVAPMALRRRSAGSRSVTCGFANYVSVRDTYSSQNACCLRRAIFS